MLMYIVFPAWLAAGFLDYLAHRRTRIETTAGTRESALHALMMAEAGLPTLMGLFLNVNAGVLLSTYAGLIAHQATSMWDIAYSNPRRETGPNEQHVHGFLEVLPFMAASFLTVLHWDQARALVPWGKERPELKLEFRRAPLPLPYMPAILTALLVFGIVPYAEELRRCLRVDPRLYARPVPAEAHGTIPSRPQEVGAPEPEEDGRTPQPARSFGN